MSKLSFSLPKYDSAIARLMGEIGKGLEAHDEILGQIRSRPVAHGGSIRQVSEPTVLDTPLQSVGAKFELSLDTLIQTDTEKFVEALYYSFEEFRSHQKKRLFEVLSQTTEAVGNSIDAKGRNFWETYIEMLETTKIHFDENGEHSFKIYLNPETAKKIEQIPATEEQLQRINEVMDAKRREHYARKRSRRISH